MRDRPQRCRVPRSGKHRLGLPFETCDPETCDCNLGRNDDHRLAYYRVLPNYGRTDDKPSMAGKFNAIPLAARVSPTRTCSSSSTFGTTCPT